MTTIGKIVFGLLIALLIGSGIGIIVHRAKTAPVTYIPNQPVNTDTAPPPVSELQKDLAEALPYPKRVPAASAYVPKDNVLEIELSEWAGYSGLIASMVASIRTLTRHLPKRPATNLR